MGSGAPVEMAWPASCGCRQKFMRRNSLAADFRRGLMAQCLRRLNRFTLRPFDRMSVLF